MSYTSGLKALREKLLEQSTGRVAPESKGLESFISSRGKNEEPQESTEDLISRGANWISEIKKASLEFKKAYEMGNEVQAVQSPLASFVGGLKEGGAKSRDAKERKESFIQRRGESSPSTYAPERPSEKGQRTSSPIPIDAEVSSVLNAIAAVESRGSGDYAAVGPVVKKGMYKGQRAYGRYQVMEGNIAPWTKAALGKELSVEEFMSDTGAQDAVAAYQLSRSKEKYGTWEDAASVWFSGRPVSKAGSASDGYATVPEYIAKFRNNFVRT